MNAVEPVDVLLAVDIGNSVIKCGRFGCGPAAPGSEPDWIGEAPLADPGQLGRLVGTTAGRGWFVSSVNRPVEQRLREWVQAERPAESYRVLSYVDVPLAIDVEFPAQVGFDRLATAVAAATLRPAGRAAIVVDAGTALKIHAVTAADAFVGGVILPGFRLAAQSLHAGTDLLPMVDASLNMTPPSVFGRNTQQAITGGLYWGAVGAVREVVTIMRHELGATTPVYVTGGDAQGLGTLIDHGVRFVPNLCLLGIAHMARQLTGA